MAFMYLIFFIFYYTNFNYVFDEIYNVIKIIKNNNKKLKIYIYLYIIKV